ncbi:MAG: LuxR C-terminal-related transcriptional regulator [Anaerolineae bacterium]
MTLLATKLYIPPTRSGLVSRPRLTERLATALERKLTLISAPAGFGKTTLVSAWVWQTGLSVAWLSLDQGDNDPTQFWRYVIAALQTVDGSIGEIALTALQPSQPLSLEPLLTALINDVVGASTPIILVLDDYHVIETRSIHAGLNFLLDRLPPHLHLIVITRADPPLFQAHRRGRAELNEIRAEALRFTVKEAAEFLNTTMGLGLSREDTVALEDRTEGWIVGLQMAALSMQGIDDKHRFVTTFAGDDRYVVDYLVEEVLQNQPPRIYGFLLQTSILERLCGSLCDAVVGGDGSRSILHDLERTNLFTVSLDTQRHWYRYHRLFADLLRHRLERSASAQEITALYLRASEWFEREGLISEAVSYALASRDDAYTAELIERHVLSLFYRSETVLIHNWLKALPEDVIRAHPLLCAVYAACTMLARRQSARASETLALVERWLQAADAALALRSEAELSDGPPRNVVTGFIAKFRAYLSQFRGDDPQTIIDLSSQVLESLPEDDLMFRSALAYNLGVAYSRLGDKEAASRAFEQAEQIGLASSDLFNASGGVGRRAVLACMDGRLHDAAEICRKGLQSISRMAGGRAVPYAGTVYITLGGVLSEWCEFEKAADMLAKGLAMLELTSARQEQQWGYIEMATIKRIQGEPAQALDFLERAERARPKSAGLVAAFRARAWLSQVDSHPRYLDDAVRWAQGLGTQLDGDGGEYDAEQLTLARVILAQHHRRSTSELSDLPSLLQFLDRQLDLARDDGLLGWEIEVLILQALALQAQRNIERALACMQHALTLAEPEGYARVFVGEAFLDGEGGPMVALLRRAAPRSRYAGKLLAVFKAQKRDTGERLVQPQTSPLIEPLTPREREILQLVALGASNQEISRKLFITVNTVKTHITHIFGKLGVARRTQAASRARELGLID